MTIGKVAKAVHIDAKTIRFYEQEGLIPRARRTANGYRIYSEQDLRRLDLIRRARLLDLSLTEVRELIEYSFDGKCSSLRSHLLPLVQKRTEEVQQRIQDLELLRQELQLISAVLSRELESRDFEDSMVSECDPCHCFGHE